MGIDPELLRALGGAGALAAIAGIASSAMKRGTDTQANRIAEKRLLLEEETADRTEWRKEREELRQERDVERARVEALHSKSEQLQQQVDTLRTELQAIRLVYERRVVQCERVQSPCQPSSRKELMDVKP